MHIFACLYKRALNYIFPLSAFMMGMRMGVFSEAIFEANHPFLFISKEVKNGLTLFI
jgi:hypothetical protein